MRTIDWPSVTYRTVAIANFLMAAAGAFFLTSSILIVPTRLGNDPAQPYFVAAYWTMVIINISFLAFLIFGSIRLFQLRAIGITICNIVFSAEIIYFVVLSLLWFLSGARNSASSIAISMSVAGATGVGNMGIGPQLPCAYPLIALGCLYLARWYRRRNGPVVARG
jgi:hypothetical protein